MSDGLSGGQRELAKLANEIGYSDGSDNDEDGGVDALIDYKNALEDRLVALLDGGAPGTDDELLTSRMNGRNITLHRWEWRELLTWMQGEVDREILRHRIEILLGDRTMAEVDAEMKAEPAYLVVGVYHESDGGRYATTVYTHNGPEAAEPLAQEACREDNDDESGEDLIRIAAVIAGDPKVVG